MLTRPKYGSDFIVRLANLRIPLDHDNIIYLPGEPIGCEYLRF